ncbi:cytochrome P450 [Salinactinospora qingdaonensis]|uniref:Cytochrome P450 n=1 Tax=Salinactinospora qingdaonensis TaxID=702744 RepID=A0ABP7FHC6_9ACTN
MTAGNRNGPPPTCPTDTALPGFPLPPEGSMGPPAEYERLRTECPFARVRHPTGAAGWFVTRYEDVRALLGDPRLTRPAVNEWPTGPQWPSPTGPALVTMMELEGPRHTALRQATAEAFSLRSVRSLRPRIRDLADEILDDLDASGSPGDLVTGFAEPFPLRVACEMTGLPYRQRHRFLGPADAALGAMLTLDQGRASIEFLRGFIGEVADHKRREPGDDILSDLVARQDAGELTEEDVICFGLSILVAGYRTPTMFLANAVLTLLTHPGHLDALRADPALLPNAVEELLRYLPVMNAPVVMVATEDIDVNGHRIDAGEAVFPAIAAANRDETVFAAADTFDITREHNPHLVFGRGEHNCVGSHVGRAELEIALAALLERFPRLELAVDPGELPWEDDSPIKSPLSLPVRW